MEFIPGVFEVLQPSAPKERMTALEKKCAIRMENITKRFGSKVIANKDVNLELYEGEILSLLGENGSGKTTLMNMLSGIYFPDEGQIYIDGQPVTIASPKDAFALGIGMIHQHFKRQSKQKNHRLIDSIIRSLLLNSIQFTRYLFSNQGI